MTRRNSSVDNLKQPIRQATAQPWFEHLTRLGFVAKGVVYLIVGLLAAQAAIGAGGRTTNTTGALQEIIVQPFGRLLLAIVAVGMVGYVLWRGAQTILDPEHSHQKLNAKRIVLRIGYAVSAIAYSGLALTAVKLILGAARDNRDAAKDWTARFLVQPFGQWLVGLVGAIVVLVGVSYLYQASTAKFQRKFNLEQMSHTERVWTKQFGRVGIAARGIVFSVIGIFLIMAALDFDPNEAVGLGGALAVLAAQPFGPWILGLVALGLIAYSIYSFIEARYRQIVHN
jgi:hypothetical protein